MEVGQAIAERRSIRHFTHERVSDNDIDLLIEALRLSPSAHNRQNWVFKVLDGDEKDHLADIMLSLFDGDTSHLPSFCRTSRVTAKVIKGADRLILCLKEKDELWDRLDLLSLGAAIENLCLQATSLGLGALWICDTVYTEEKILEAFSLEGLELVSAIALGHPASIPAPRPRKAKEEIIR